MLYGAARADLWSRKGWDAEEECLQHGKFFILKGFSSPSDSSYVLLIRWTAHQWLWCGGSDLRFNDACHVNLGQLQLHRLLRRAGQDVGLYGRKVVYEALVAFTGFGLYTGRKRTI